MARATDYPKIYNSWRGMRYRCMNKKHSHAKWYSEKGITICSEWDDYLVFEQWALENGWETGLTIERKDNSLGYSPDNCMWATYKQQARNQTKNVFITAFGKTRCVNEWAEITGISDTLIRARIDRLEWSPEIALSLPVGVIKSGPKPRSAVQC